jgi:hypothetical protein
MAIKRKCPVCGKPLTEQEFDKALGLWKDKQEHIKHLEAEQKKLMQQELENKKKFEVEKKKLQAKEQTYKKQLTDQAKNFKQQQTELKTSLEKKMKTDITKGVEKGVKEQRQQFKKQEGELRKTQNKMKQLENSLNVSAKKYDTANAEIKKLKEQIEKGITPQIEGLLEEGKLLAKLKELFPIDRFEHPGKGGDIIQMIIEQRKEIGKIVYECKKVKTFNKHHVEQAKQARNFRQADFAILVTNAFPSKKQYYFVDKTVFVISPVSLEPITYTLRESLVKMAMLKMSNEAKQKAVQRVYDYLSSSDYNNKMNDVSNQLMELGKDLKQEIASHRRTWEKRYHIYSSVYSDITGINYSLKDLVQNRLEEKPRLMLPEKSKYLEIDELK